jgi:hypothetical protein
MSEYRQELNDLFRKFEAAKAEERIVTPIGGEIRGIKIEGAINAKGELDETSARNLHAELCRLSGMTADQIIEEWNRRSPEDPW